MTNAEQQIAESILNQLTKQAFADWYNEGGQCDAYISGGYANGNQAPNKQQVLESIHRMFIVGTPLATPEPKKQYFSCAKWPIVPCGPDEQITKDENSSLELALSVCDMLDRRGYGGDAEVFPISVWVENEKGEILTTLDS